MALNQADKDFILLAVREGTADIHDDVKIIRKVAGQHSIELMQIRAEISGMKTTLREHSIFLEDLESRFTTVCEAIDENLDVRSQVRDHETRLTTVESVQTLLRATVKEHARKLNILTIYEH